MRIKTKRIVLVIALVITAAMCLAPNFHPEQAVLDKYYWQADIAIHGGYYLLLTLLLLLLKLKIPPLKLAVSLAGLSFFLEGLQYFSFKRAVSLMDMGSNVLGITLAILLHLVIRRHLKKRPA